MERGDDDVRVAAGGAHAGRDRRERGARGAGTAGRCEERRRPDVAEADERDPQPEPCDRARPARRGSVAPAPTGTAPAARTARTVSSSAGMPKSPAWLLARFSMSRPAKRTTAARWDGRPRKVQVHRPVREGRAAVRGGDRRPRRHPAPARAALQRDRRPGRRSCRTQRDRHAGRAHSGPAQRGRLSWRHGWLRHLRRGRLRKNEQGPHVDKGGGASTSASAAVDTQRSGALAIEHER